ncbi:hypothetical protein PG996_013914 [Apiospora saccharicola]|uniref:C2H2-type domain-containing protein n=1 Tax=Apiospora saccharicola TaxID=335842 RepID=A0ABR1TGU4_9PEZI
MAPPHTCQTCNKVLSSAHNLRRHQQTHQNPYMCHPCGAPFAREDQLQKHNLNYHGVNISPFICYIKGCARRRLGLMSEELLKQHLANCHGNATLAENNVAAREQGVEGIEQPAAADGDLSSEEEEGEIGDDTAMVDAGDQSAQVSQEDKDKTGNDGAAQSSTHAQLKNENETLKAENQGLKEEIIRMEIDHASELTNLQNQHRANLLRLRQQLTGGN